MHPVLFEVGGVVVFTWGAVAAVAVVLGCLLVARMAGRRGLPAEAAVETVVVAALCALAAARVTFVFERLPFYLENPAAMLSVRGPGMSSLGGLLGMIAGGAWWARRRGLRPLALLDVIAPGLALMVGLGRIGCFYNGCCEGRVCDLPWAAPVAHLGVVTWRHPSQLYESALVLLLCAGLCRALARWRREGDVFVTAVVGYATIRFLVEIVREGPVLSLGLTPAQAACLAFAVVAGGFWRVHRSSLDAAPRHAPDVPPSGKPKGSVK